MNLKRAQETLKLQSLARERRHYHKEVLDRVIFLEKWSKVYKEELDTLNPKLSVAQEMVDVLPNVKDVYEATKLINKINAVDKEIKSYEHKRRRASV